MRASRSKLTTLGALVAISVSIRRFPREPRPRTGR